MAALAATVPTPVQARQQCGVASFYGLNDGYHGRRTASGKRFNTWSNQAAHPWLPFGTKVKVKTKSGKATTVVITDRGPFSGGRIIDLSTASFRALAPLSNGLKTVCISW